MSVPERCFCMFDFLDRFKKGMDEEATELHLLWLSRLNEFRQRWPEWKSLYELINTTPFSLYHCQEADADYLVSKEHFSGRRILFNTSCLTDDSYLPEFFPRYLVTLYDLKYVKKGMSKREMCRMPGGIASCLKSESLMFMEKRNPRLFERIIGYNDPGRLNLNTGDLYTLQTNPFGDYIFSDRTHQVQLYSIKDGDFKVIARLNNFIHYCVYCFVNGMDWYTDGYTRDRDTYYFDVAYIKGT